MFRLAQVCINRMSLSDTRSPAITHQACEGPVRMRDLLAKEGPRGVADSMLPKLLAEATRRDGTDAVREVRAMIESAAPEAIAAAIGALMGRPDSTSGLSAISCATLVVAGELDEL